MLGEGPIDAGADGGVDGGNEGDAAESSDAMVEDASRPRDAGSGGVPDAGSPRVDAAVTTRGDAASDGDTPTDEVSGCAIGGTHRSRSSWLVIAALALTWARARRKVKVRAHGTIMQ
jgi:hypothetical protein